MLDFKPIEGVPYKQDYYAVFREIRGMESHTSQIERYRQLCQEDLFFLLYFGLGRHFINSNFKTAYWWVQRIREVEDGPRSGTLDMWFRESGKSTIMTTAENIQDILKDPEERICIFSYNRPLAKDFLAQIMRDFEDSLLLKQWFPDILYENPKKDSPSWSKDKGLIVKRKGNPKEATIEAWGLIEGAPVGRHFTKLDYDDVVTPDLVTGPEMVAKVLQAFQLSDNLGSGPNTRVRIKGTRYDFDDLYGTLIEMVKSGDLNYQIRTHPGEYLGPDGKTHYHIHDEDYFRQKRIKQGSYVYSAQILLKPVHPDDQTFKTQHLRFYDKWPDGADDWPKYLLGDLAGQKNKKNDRTAFIVVGVDENDNWHVLDAVAGKWNQTEQVRQIMDLVSRYKLPAVHIEEGILLTGLESNIKDAQRQEGLYFSIKGMRHGGRNKDDRIRALVPRYEAGKIILHPRMDKLMTELRQHPSGKYRDMIDALAYGMDVIKPRTPGRMRRRRRVGGRPTAHNRRGAW